MFECCLAGNQASVRIIRGMALGLITDDNKTKILLRECVMGMAMCFFLSAVGLVRVHFSEHTTAQESLAITLSLSAIVFFSVIIGSLLPFLLRFCGFDPVHASTSIQVIMDISGVLITCLISTLILKTSLTA
jgi:Mg/Co/Ni transporter MgtE